MLNILHDLIYSLWIKDYGTISGKDTLPRRLVLVDYENYHIVSLSNTYRSIRQSTNAMPFGLPNTTASTITIPMLQNRKRSCKGNLPAPCEVSVPNWSPGLTPRPGTLPTSAHPSLLGHWDVCLLPKAGTEEYLPCGRRSLLAGKPGDSSGTEFSGQLWGSLLW